MKQATKKLEERAAELLKKVGVSAAPVPVERVARSIGLTVTAADLGDHISGVLVINEHRGMIGYNPSHAPVRQRFTIAHEIGHFELHTKGTDLFIDKQFTAVFRRDMQSATGEDLKEIEANGFAACLLMPKQFVLNEIENMHFDLGDEFGLTELADRFQVSTQAMSLRLGTLGIF